MKPVTRDNLRYQVRLCFLFQNVEQLSEPGLTYSTKFNIFKKFKFWDAWAAQSVEHMTLDFGSSHELRAMGSSPTMGSGV